MSNPWLYRVAGLAASLGGFLGATAHALHVDPSVDPLLSLGSPAIARSMGLTDATDSCYSTATQSLTPMWFDEVPAPYVVDD